MNIPDIYNKVYKSYKEEQTELNKIQLNRAFVAAMNFAYDDLAFKQGRSDNTLRKEFALEEVNRTFGLSVFEGKYNEKISSKDGVKQTPYRLLYTIVARKAVEWDRQKERKYVVSHIDPTRIHKTTTDDQFYDMAKSTLIGLEKKKIIPTYQAYVEGLMDRANLSKSEINLFMLAHYEGQIINGETVKNYKQIAKHLNYKNVNSVKVTLSRSRKKIINQLSLEHDFKDNPKFNLLNGLPDLDFNF